MIIGIGNDIVDMRRVEKAFSRHGDRFARRCFTDTEIADSDRTRHPGTRMAFYAKRFAAKEACAKALGTGFRNGIAMKDIGVTNDNIGRPSLTLTGAARARLDTLTPPGMTATLHLGLSDEPPYAQAFVIIAAEKDVS